METENNCYKDGLLFTAMVTVECITVGLNTLFKAASLKGLNYYVFIVYSYATATLVLLPLTFIFRSSMKLPSLKFPLYSRIFLLGLIGFLSQVAGYKGIEYSSPTLASAISNLTPAFTFALAIIFRMEKLYLRSSSTHAKIIGSIVSISGALVVVLYKGPMIFSTSSVPSVPLQWPLVSASSQSDWVIGGLLLTVQFLLLSVWYIIQTQVIKMYPAELLVVFLYNLSAAVISAPVCLMAETDFSSWRLRFDIALVAILYSGCFTSISTVVHTFGLHLKGPVYIASFRPLSIAIAAGMGVLFLGDALHIGSVIGAVIISIGFYAVLWGKAEEVRTENSDSVSGFINRTPLLQNLKVEET